MLCFYYQQANRKPNSNVQRKHTLYCNEALREKKKNRRECVYSEDSAYIICRASECDIHTCIHTYLSCIYIHGVDWRFKKLRGRMVRCMVASSWSFRSLFLCGWKMKQGRVVGGTKQCEGDCFAMQLLICIFWERWWGEVKDPSLF